MSVRLVSTNDHPKTSYEDAYFRNALNYPESLQLNEQEEANTIAAFVAGHIGTFVAGALFILVSEIVILLIVKGVPWS